VGEHVPLYALAYVGFGVGMLLEEGSATADG